MANNRREQTPKDRLNSRIRAEVDRARSNAGQPHKLATDYRRKPKHPKKGWE